MTFITRFRIIRLVSLSLTLSLVFQVGVAPSNFSLSSTLSPISSSASVSAILQKMGDWFPTIPVQASDPSYKNLLLLLNLTNPEALNRYLNSVRDFQNSDKRRFVLPFNLERVEEEQIRKLDYASGINAKQSGGYKGHTKGIRGLAIGTNRNLATASQDGTLFLWGKDRFNWPTRQLLGKHEGIAYSLDFHPDGEIVASGGGDGKVRLWDVAKRKELEHSPLEGPARSVMGVRFSPDGNRLAAWGGNTLYMWQKDRETERWRLLFQRQAYGRGITAFSFSPDGNTFVTAGLDSTLIFWDLSSGEAEKLNELKGHNGAVTTVSFSLNGEMLASGDAKGEIKLWDVILAKEIRTLTGHSEKVWSLDFNLDGRYLASGGSEGGIYFWSVGTGKLLRKIEGHGGGVTQLIYNPREPLLGRRREERNLGSSLSQEVIVSTGADIKIRYLSAPSDPFGSKESSVSLPLKSEEIEKLLSASALKLFLAFSKHLQPKDLSKFVLSLSQTSANFSWGVTDHESVPELGVTLLLEVMDRGTISEFERAVQVIQRLIVFSSSAKREYLLSSPFQEKWSPLPLEQRLALLEGLLDIPEAQFERLLQIKNPSAIDFLFTLNPHQWQRATNFFQAEESLLFLGKFLPQNFLIKILKQAFSL